MCSGRVDLSFIFRALSHGNDGVFIGTCHLGDCHYITHGNYDTLGKVLLSKKILEYLGLNPERVRIAQTSAGEGIQFAEIMVDFSKTVRDLGPLGEAEGIDQATLKLKLQAVNELIPYIRVVQNERLNVHFETVEEYYEYFASEELEKLFKNLIGDKLTIAQIIALLREKPLSTGEMAGILGLTSSEVAKHINNTAIQVLIRYQNAENLFALA